MGREIESRQAIGWLYILKNYVPRFFDSPTKMLPGGDLHMYHLVLCKPMYIHTFKISMYVCKLPIANAATYVGVSFCQERIVRSNPW
jgi:hypothetical protein